MVHGAFRPFGDDHRQAIEEGGHRLVKCSFLGGTELPQDKVGHAHRFRLVGHPDANAVTHKPFPQMLPDAAYPVVSTITPTEGNLQLSQRQGILIVDEDDVSGGNAVKTRNRPNRLATAVHKGHRLDQKAASPTQGGCGRLGLALATGLPAGAELTGKGVDQHESGVVPGLPVVRPRVSEPDHHQHLHGRSVR